jgi:hypothetical protein
MDVDRLTEAVTLAIIREEAEIVLVTSYGEEWIIDKNYLRGTIRRAIMGTTKPSNRKEKRIQHASKD